MLQVLRLYWLGIAAIAILLNASITLYAQTDTGASAIQPLPFTPLLQDGAAIKNLEAALGAQNPNYSSIETRARELLQKYYRQLPVLKDKRIQRERNMRPTRYLKLDANARRLISQARKQSPAAPNFIGEVPYLFRLHNILAQSYASQKQSLKAVNAYAMAWRYAAIAPPSLAENARLAEIQKNVTQNFLSQMQTTDEANAPNANTNDTLNAAPLQSDDPREKRYAWMRRIFANSDRLAQEDDRQLQRAAREFQSEYENYQKLKQAYYTARPQVDVAELQQLRQRQANPTPAAARQKRDDLQRQWQQSRQKLERIRQNEYQRYLQQRRQRHSAAAYQMALQVRRLELENLELLQRRKRWQGKKNLQERQDLPNDFSGFRALLQFAHKIDPFQAEYARLLSDEFRRVGDTVAAIYYTRLFLALAQAQEQTPPNTNQSATMATPSGVNTPDTAIARYTLRLAGLYQKQGNHIQAADAYEFLLQQPLNAAQQQQARKQLADVHYAHTGKLARAVQLYQAYLAQRSENASPTPSKLSGENMRHIENYTIHKKLAAIARRRLQTATEKEHLQQASAAYRLLQNAQQQAHDELQELEERELRLKRELMGNTDSKRERDYYFVKNMQIAPKKDEIANLAAHIRNLNFNAIILERLAWLAQREQRWQQAETYYREIVRNGTGSQIDRARANLKAIALSQQDGILRSAAQRRAPDFER